jgi:ATP synthase protein I
VAGRKKPFTALVGEYTALAFLLPTTTFVGFAIGYYLDKSFGTGYLKIVFLLLGIAAGFVQLVRQLIRDTKNDQS